MDERFYSRESEVVVDEPQLLPTAICFLRTRLRVIPANVLFLRRNVAEVVHVFFFYSVLFSVFLGLLCWSVLPFVSSSPIYFIGKCFSFVLSRVLYVYHVTTAGQEGGQLKCYSESNKINFLTGCGCCYNSLQR